MKLNGEIRIDAPRERVYEALNDPEILQASIPGCEAIKQLSETELAATVVTRIGPIRANFTGHITLSDLNPPSSYTISGVGKGGTAGFAKGSAKVTLEEDGDGTIVRYDIEIDVGGKLAQLGGRLIEGTAKKLSGDFFTRFKKELTGDEDAGAAVAATAEADGRMKASLPLVLSVAVIAALVALFFLFG